MSGGAALTAHALADLVLDAVVYLRIVDPYKANYAVDDPVTAMLILAQTTVRSRIGVRRPRSRSDRRQPGEAASDRTLRDFGRR